METENDILFKGKLTNSDKWIEGYFCVLGGFSYIVPDYAQLRHPCDPDIENSFFEVDSNTVVQYTGLNDKFGNKIFRGDKIKYTKHDGYLLPSFDDGFITYSYEYASFGIISLSAKIIPLYFTSIDCINEDFLNHVEVIGNIYD